MITISLDEQGDFEGIKKEYAPIFIGGILYDDMGDNADYQNERKRIEGYLKAVCQSVGAKYSRDLHFRIDSQGRNNGACVAKVKEKLKQTLSEFIQKGTFEKKEIFEASKERKGRYYIFCMLKSDEGKKTLLEEGVSELIKDSFASNLYVHMAEDVISRIVFHNPVIEDIKEIRMDIATRRVVLERDEELALNEKLEEYTKLGYQQDREHSSTEKKVILITNPDVYRTAMEREMMNSEKSAIRMDRIGVKSIYYEQPDKRMVFLYLADIICSILGYKPKGESAREWLSYFKETADKLTGHSENLLYAYDTADTFFRKAWERLEEKDYYKALSIAYEGMHAKTPIAEYYSKTWYPKLLDRIAKEKNLSAYTMALRKLQESILNNNLNQDKVMFIFHTLERIEPNILFGNREDKAVLYELYDTGVAAYCHIGDSRNALKYFNKCEEYAGFIGIERYLGTRNQMAVLLNDSFQPGKALEIALDNFSYHELISDMKQQIFQKEDYRDYLEHGKTLSQLGQAYAFAGDSRAELCFLEALEEFEKNSPNYLITLSYLLHYYIQVGDKDKYLERSREYFGENTSLDKQLKYIVHEGMELQNTRFTLKYALYVYVKGLYYFRMDDISDSLLDKLSSIRETMEKLGIKSLKQLNGHPWELICKYLALIMIKKGRREKADVYMDMAEKLLENKGATLEAIILFGKVEYAQITSNLEERDRITKELWLFMKDMFGIFEMNYEEVEAFQRYSLLAEHFQYMYR